MGKKHKSDRGDRHSSRSPTRHSKKDDAPDLHRKIKQEVDTGWTDNTANGHDWSPSRDARRDRDKESASPRSPDHRHKDKHRDRHSGDKDGHRKRRGDSSGRDDDSPSNRRSKKEKAKVKKEEDRVKKEDERDRKSDSKSRHKDRHKDGEKDKKDDDKQKANLGLSGKLAEDTNTFRGVVIKYNEPAEARKPKIRWRFYQFKGEEDLPTLFVHRQSAYLIGRDRLIADIPVDHPSCSKQHAVLQFRHVEYQRENGSTGKRVSPYVIDLGSTNKTYLNNKPIEAQKYHELREKDVLKFGYSSREYVLLHDKSADSTETDEDPD